MCSAYFHHFFFDFISYVYGILRSFLDLLPCTQHSLVNVRPSPVPIVWSQQHRTC
jgi:hypothetical protein